MPSWVTCGPSARPGRLSEDSRQSRQVQKEDAVVHHCPLARPEVSVYQNRAINAILPSNVQRNSQLVAISHHTQCHRTTRLANIAKSLKLYPQIFCRGKFLCTENLKIAYISTLHILNFFVTQNLVATQICSHRVM